MTHPRARARRARSGGRAHQRLATALIAAAVSFSCAQFSPAQEGPTLIGAQEPQQWLHLNNIHPWFETLYRYQSSTIKSPNVPKTTFTENRFEEKLSLETTGYVRHPNLVELNLAGTFGLHQDYLDTNGTSDDVNDTILDYDLSATFLRKQTAPVTLYARQYRTVIDRTFGASIDSINSSYGAYTDIRSDTLPTHLEIYHSDQSQDSADNTGNFSLAQDVFNWHSDYHPTKNQTLNWNYSFTQAEERPQDFEPNNYQVNDASLDHSVDFGKDGRSNLTSSGSFFDQTGNLPIRRQRWDETLRLHHTDDFETRYQYTYDDQTYSDSQQTQNRGQAGFTHQLYKSLFTTGNIGAEQSDRSAEGQPFDAFETFADIGTEYRKTVPFGLVTSFLRFSWDQQNNDARTGNFQLLDQDLAVPTAGDIFLNGTNIRPESLVLWDARRHVRYQEGIDYKVVDANANYVRIRPTSTLISPGDLLSADYQLGELPAYNLTTDSVRTGIRYDIDRGFLKGLSPYVRYAHQEQTVDSPVQFAFVPDTYDDIVAGLEYRVWRITVGAEHQIHDSVLLPFDADRFFVRYINRIDYQTVLTLNASLISVQYNGEDPNHDNLYTCSAHLERAFSSRLSGSITLVYRLEQDDSGGDTTGLEEQLRLNWRYRQTTAYLQLRNASYDSDFQSTENLYFQIGLRRDF